MKRSAKVLIIIGCLLIGFVFTNVTLVPATPNFSKLHPDCFVEDAANPLLTRDVALPGSDWNDPSVLKIGNEYVMYASSDENFNMNIKIYRLVSTDLKKWKRSPRAPVLTATKGAWDKKAVETPSVVFFKGQYHMFYTGYKTSHMDVMGYSIGHAVSKDGITWLKDTKPLLSPKHPKDPPNLAFNQYVVGEPGAVVFRDKLYLYFTALGANAGLQTMLQVVGLTITSDGETWSKPKVALEPDQNLYPRSQWVGYSTPQPIVLNNEVHLFFDVAQEKYGVPGDKPWRQLRIHHASSRNGVNNWKIDDAPILRESDAAWTSGEVLAPAALLDGSKLHLFYAGNDRVTLGIGLATCQL